jgi:hypothetical protein
MMILIPAAVVVFVNRRESLGKPVLARSAPVGSSKHCGG